MTHDHGSHAPITPGAPASTPPDSDPFGRPYWEDRYAAPGLTWSGNPNQVLVDEVTGLAPGRALDIGSGEGGDALWLARRGWQVTGVDIAEKALAKASDRIASLDPAAGSRIAWEQHDLREWAPAARSFDLVTSHFMHLADPARTTLFRALAEAIAPGGTLLIVGHDMSELEPTEHNAHHRELMFGISDVLVAIDGSGLVVDVAESRPRAATSAQPGAAVVRDVIVRASRPA